MKRTKILLVGVGGQGVRLAAEGLAEAGRRADLGVTVGELHGMAQRGGSVQATVLFGPGRTAFIGTGEADLVLGFEPLEALRALPFISGRTTVIVSTARIAPFLLALRNVDYPDVDGILARLRAAAAEVHALDGRALAEKAGSTRVLNVVLLGALAGYRNLPFQPEHLLHAVTTRSPQRYLDANRRAFQLGLECIAERRAGGGPNPESDQGTRPVIGDVETR